MSTQQTQADKLRFATLGSGSEGNALVIEATVAGRITRVLLDCGFSVKELDKRLSILGLSATDLHAVLITHEHHDHAHGAYRAAKRWRLPLYATYGTLSGAYDVVSSDWQDYHSLEFIHADQHFSVGVLHITPIPVPHDAREPVQFRFIAAGREFGVLTDAGHTTAHMQAQYAGLNGMVLECNHCPDMVRASSYPHSLKQRILGDWGHLSNQQAASFLAQIDVSQLDYVWCAHLSQSNNHPELAQNTLMNQASWQQDKMSVLEQTSTGPWFTV